MFCGGCRKAQKSRRKFRTIIMKQNFIKIFLLISCISAISISKAQFWQPLIVNPTTAPPNNGGFGAAGPLPTTLLRVNEGSVLFDGSTGNIPVLGTGTRLMWVPELRAFRAGGVLGSDWDIMGRYSFAGGFNTRVVGDYSTAFGSNIDASGDYSFAAGEGNNATAPYTTSLGYYNNATGPYAFAAGYSNTVNGGNSVGLGYYNSVPGNYSTALGNSCNANGVFSMAMGTFATAAGDYSMAIGSSNPSTPSPFTNPISSSLWASFACDSPTLFIGPGNGPGTFGNVGIGTSSPTAPLHVFAHTSDAATFIPDGAVGTNPSVHIGDPFGYPGMFMIRNGNRGDIRYEGTQLEFAAKTGTSGTGATMIITNDQRVFINSSYTGAYVFEITGSAFATGGIWQNSDMRFKKDIEKVNNASDMLKKLNPVTYQFRKDEFEKRNFPSGRVYGFIAQELEEVMPEATKVDKDGYYGVNYEMIIPVLTGALQEQTKAIEEQKTIIDDLVKRVEALETASAKNQSKQNAPANSDGAYLKQNVPNPSAQSTVIKFYLPSNVASANINFYDMSGKEIKSITINTRGEEASVTINAGELTAGMYMYSLIADGKEIDTKKMIITQ